MLPARCEHRPANAIASKIPMPHTLNTCSWLTELAVTVQVAIAQCIYVHYKILT